MSKKEAPNQLVTAIIPRGEFLAMKRLAHDQKITKENILQIAANIGLAGFEIGEGNFFGLMVNKQNPVQISISQEGRKKIDEIIGIPHLDWSGGAQSVLVLKVESSTSEKISQEAFVRNIPEGVLYGEIISTGIHIIRACQHAEIDLYIKVNGVTERVVF